MLASPSIQSAVLALNAPASPELGGTAAIPATGFDTLLAAIVPALPAAQPTPPVAALPPSGNALPVELAPATTIQDVLPEPGHNPVPFAPHNPAQPQLRPGVVLPRALAGTAPGRIAAGHPATSGQPATPLPATEQAADPAAVESAAPAQSVAPALTVPGAAAMPTTPSLPAAEPTLVPVAAPQPGSTEANEQTITASRRAPRLTPAPAADVAVAPARLVSAGLDPSQTAPAPRLAAAVGAMPLAPGLRRSATANPAEPGIVQPLAQHPATNQPGPIPAAPFQVPSVRPSPGKAVHAPHATGLIRAASRANPVAVAEPALPPLLDPVLPTEPSLSTAPLFTPLVTPKRGPTLTLLPQPAVPVSDTRIELPSRGLAPTVQVAVEQVLFRPVPASDTITQFMAPPLEPASAISAWMGPARSVAEAAQPLDFAALISRIESAREAGGSAPVTFSLRHEDFGPVAVRFETDAGRISVDLSSPDPDFARAVAAAQPAASDIPRPDTARADSGRSENSRSDSQRGDSQRGDTSARGHEAPTGHQREGGGSSRGSSDERANRPAVNNRTSASAKAAPDQTDLFA